MGDCLNKVVSWRVAGPIPSRVAIAVIAMNSKPRASGYPINPQTLRNRRAREWLLTKRGTYLDSPWFDEFRQAVVYSFTVIAFRHVSTINLVPLSTQTILCEHYCSGSIDPPITIAVICHPLTFGGLCSIESDRPSIHFADTICTSQFDWTHLSLALLERKMCAWGIQRSSEKIHATKTIPRDFLPANTSGKAAFTHSLTRSETKADSDLMKK